jgi:hypothetical protein
MNTKKRSENWSSTSSFKKYAQEQVVEGLLVHASSSIAFSIPRETFHSTFCMLVLYQTRKTLISGLTFGRKWNRQSDADTKPCLVRSRLYKRKKKNY